MATQVKNASKPPEQQRHALAAMIEQNAVAIEQRWLVLVRADIAASRGLSMTELRDAIADYLSRLALALRQTDESSETVLGTTVWEDVAREHSVMRIRLGFNIEQLVHEFILLRRVLVDFARNEGLLKDSSQADRLVDLLEAAISVAVKSYVESRDQEFRKAQAEHVGFITHELRNPLTTLTMAVSEMCNRLPQTEEFKKLCSLATVSHQRLRALISSVLLSEKLQAPNIVVNPKDTNLGAIVDESIRNAAEVAQRKGLNLNLTYDANMQLRIDPTLTISALSNLIDNAVKYTDSGTIDLKVESNPNELVVHVRDHCHGISDEELKTVFEPFRRGESNKPGTGLGLSIARRAVEVQGGQIHAESLPNEGCHFWFQLPRVIQLARIGSSK